MSEDFLASGGLGFDDTLLNVALPGFVIADAAFCLLARQFHFHGYVINAGRSVLFLIVAVAWGALINLVSLRPFRLNIGSCLFTSLFRHTLSSRG